MSEALANMAKRVPNTDVVIEVRDSRLPFASDEAGLDKLTARCRRRLVLLHKADLIPSSRTLTQVGCFPVDSYHF